MKERLTRLALAAGASKTGFARAGEVDAEVVASFSRCLAQGRHGGMEYLANHPHIRRNPSLLLDGYAAEARTVMVCAFPYYHAERQHADAAQIAMYAHGSDYHEVLRRRLQPLVAMVEAEGERGRVCVDSAPILERYWAVRAGVGFRGVNGQLIVPGMGSYFFLAEIVTTADVEPDTPCTLKCQGCGRCVRACPGGAIGADGSFDARRCLSYLTIEHRGELPDMIGEGDGAKSRPMAEAMGNRVYGCDECQRVCPHNSDAVQTGIGEFGLRESLRHLTAGDIASMEQGDFSRIFSHSAVKRVKLAGLQRNAAMLLGNRRK